MKTEEDLINLNYLRGEHPAEHFWDEMEWNVDYVPDRFFV